MLFCGVLHQEAKILTPTGRPSFKAAHLGQFQGTDHLQNAGKTQLIANFCASMLNHTERDSRYHPQLKLTGTVTYRCAGSGGINIQALPRRHKEFMSCLGNEEGYEYVSVDCIAAEPSVISELTGDVNYKKIVFDLKNCAPYWEDGVLMLNDIYLSVLSTTPFGRTYLKHIWDTHIFPAGSFVEQWLVDSEIVKSVCKKYRTVAKSAVLSAGYGAGAAKIHKSISEAGFEITPTEAANLHKGFWKLFSGVKQYAEDCAKECSEDNNCVRNRFGQIAWLSSSHKAFNYKVQSSINPIIQFFTRAILEEMPELAFITWIHDEAIFRLPFGSRFDFIKAHERATARTNNWLGFQRVTMGFGMAFGSNLYEAK
jgi:DNA polymerase I-like protein with 3'-5' exonuclease and polymerase domains